MDLIIEIIGELALESILEVIHNRNVPIVIRGLLLVIISLFYLGIIGAFIILGISLFKESLVASIILFGCALLLLILYILLLIKLVKKGKRD